MLAGALAPGTLLGNDFRVLRPLESGGMGSVYVAEQLSTGQQRALKVMHPALVQNPRSRERFEQEARVGSRIASDHVVQVIAAGIDPAQGIPWLAMELLSGQTLAAAIARQGRFSFGELLRVFRPLCHALAAAHAVGVVHRDIKPENVFLATAQSADRDLSVKVLDFGIAKLVAEAQDTGTANVGTPLWMAPEQTDLRAAIGPAADIWALGLVAYRMLTGRHYWRAANDEQGSMTALMREVLVEPIERASLRATEQGTPQALPAGFDDWFARTVHRDPGARFQSAGEALAFLERLGASTSATAVSLTPPAESRTARPSGRKWLAAGAAGVILLIGGALALALVVGLVFRSEIESALGASPPTAAPAPAAPAATVVADGTAPSEEPAEPTSPAPTATATSTTARSTAPSPPATTATPAGTQAAEPEKKDSALAPFDRAEATAKVNAAAAQAASACKSQKGDAASESYSGTIGFHADGSRTGTFMGVGGARSCVKGHMDKVTYRKYAPDPAKPWTAEVVSYNVVVK